MRRVTAATLQGCDGRPKTVFPDRLLDLPDLLADLDRVPMERLPDLIGALEEAKARAWGRLMTPAPRGTAPEDPDEMVDVRRAAGMLGMSPTWVYRNARHLPFTRRHGARALRFSVAGIRRYLTTRRCP